MPRKKTRSGQSKHTHTFYSAEWAIISEFTPLELMAGLKELGEFMKTFHPNKKDTSRFKSRLALVHMVDILESYVDDYENFIMPDWRGPDADLS